MAEGALAVVAAHPETLTELAISFEANTTHKRARRSCSKRASGVREARQRFCMSASQYALPLRPDAWAAQLAYAEATDSALRSAPRRARDPHLADWAVQADTTPNASLPEGLRGAIANFDDDNVVRTPFADLGGIPDTKLPPALRQPDTD